MASVVWTPLASSELEEILNFIAFESGRPDAADRIGAEVQIAVDDHLRIGRPGHRHEAMPSEWRYLRYKRWLIAYEPLDDGLVVHRIVDAVRDLPKLFAPDK